MVDHCRPNEEPPRLTTHKLFLSPSTSTAVNAVPEFALRASGPSTRAGLGFSVVPVLGSRSEVHDVFADFTVKFFDL